MCGIVGYVGLRSASQILFDGLKRLEYRGYDSSGLAIVNPQDAVIGLRRTVGKLSNLETVLKRSPLTGQVGLGHTRWATHGIPSEENAHPHSDCSKKIVLIHNGIIENYSQLKAQLIKKGHRFISQTDSEVIAHLIEDEWKKAGRDQKRAGGDGHFLRTTRKRHFLPESSVAVALSEAVPSGGSSFREKEYLNAVRRSLLSLEGAYALGLVCADFPDFIIAARKDCPLVIGLGTKENFLASDVPALLPHTRRTIFLNQKEMAVLRKDEVQCYSLNGRKIKKSVTQVRWNPIQAEKSGYKHFMLKEIMEQPSAVEDTLRGRLFSGTSGFQVDVSLKNSVIKNVRRILLIACGTSYHAALVGRFWFETIAKIPCQVEIASEFRYRPAFLDQNVLAIFISQSGETADTLAALRVVKKSQAATLALCNVLGATMTREADSTFYTHCGPEIGVASTKAFVGQLTALILLALHFANAFHSLPDEKLKELVQAILKLPGWIRETLTLSKKVEAIGKKYHARNHFLYLGRNLNYPIALEGALKLKEISYIHAEGYPAGEMKHGPIALIDKKMPLVALATESGVYEKICSNIQEAKARGGMIIAIASEGDSNLRESVDEIIFVPKVPETFSPILNVVPLQLLAYHIACLRGCDVDQPRNLAKSVTVE